MIYYALYTGHGDGCDYTIGCNRWVEKLSATTLEEAKTEAVERAPNGVEVSRDVVYTDKIMVLAVTEAVDLGSEIEAARTADMERRQAAAKAAKLAEFERLKRELGK